METPGFQNLEWTFVGSTFGNIDWAEAGIDTEDTGGNDPTYIDATVDAGVYKVQVYSGTSTSAFSQQLADGDYYFTLSTVTETLPTNGIEVYLDGLATAIPAYTAQGQTRVLRISNASTIAQWLPQPTITDLEFTWIVDTGVPSSIVALRWPAGAGGATVTQTTTDDIGATSAFVDVTGGTVSSNIVGAGAAVSTPAQSIAPGCYRVTATRVDQPLPSGNGQVDLTPSAGPVGFTAAQQVFYLAVFANGGAQWTREQCCVAEGTRVLTAAGEAVRIERLRPGDAVVDQRGAPLGVRRVVRFEVPADDFVRLSGGLLVRRDHAVLDHQGRECPVQERADAEAVRLAEPRRVYTLVTERRAFVQMEGANAVATWAEAAWREERGRAPPHRELA